jgi:hypothetical protein
MPLWGTSRLIGEIPVKSVETAQCTLAGIEPMHLLRKGQWAGGAEQGLTATEQFYALAAWSPPRQGFLRLL